MEDLSTTKKAKSGFRNIFSNMKKSKSMEKLNERADMVHRDIEVNSQSSGGEKEPEKPKKRRTKKVPEPPTRKQSMGTDPIEISSPSQDSFECFITGRFQKLLMVAYVRYHITCSKCKNITVWKIQLILRHFNLYIVMLAFLSGI